MMAKKAKRTTKSKSKSTKAKSPSGKKTKGVDARTSIPKAPNGRAGTNATIKSTKAKNPKAKDQSAKPTREKRTSMLDAAAQVLKASGKPMKSRELIDAMADQNLWTSPSGKTPWGTLHAAVTREISKSLASGGNTISRFRKVDRGLFAFNTEGK